MTYSKNISIQDYDYYLNEEKIAKYPLSKRDESKLLIYEKNKQIEDRTFKELPDYIKNNSLMVFNDSLVINSRFFFHKDTGAKIEIFCLEPYAPNNYTKSLSSKKSCTWKCIVGNSKKWKNQILSKNISIDDVDVILKAKKLEIDKGSFLIEFSWNSEKVSFYDIMRSFGELPIPPYLNRDADKSDLSNYQTVYANNPGSVAAPTAGLHFTDELIENLNAKNVVIDSLTLHIGAGTFAPVKSESVLDHLMHIEHFEIKKSSIELLRKHYKNLTVVGTTSVRTLESLYCIGMQIMNNIKSNNYPIEKFFVSQWETYSYNELLGPELILTTILDYMNKHSLDFIRCATQIIIVPGYDFKFVKKLITNFHQPKSTLLLLVAALLGEDWEKVYQHALDNNYRFLSYGDGMLLSV